MKACQPKRREEERERKRENENTGERERDPWPFVPCDDPEGGGAYSGERLKMEGINVYLGLIHFVVQQKPTQNCKAIFHQLKNEVEN